MALRRLFQTFAAAESQPGVAVANAALLAPANGDFLVIDPQLTYSPELFDRANINRASLSPLMPLAGVVTGQLQFQIELAGTGGALVPKWGLLLRACGMREVATSAKEIGAITDGPFHHGETVTQATSGATGIVLHDTYSGAGRLLIHSTTGVWTATTGIITGSISGATAPGLGTALWTLGTSWFPNSLELLEFENSASTGTNNSGDPVKGATSEAIGILNANVTGAGTVTLRVLDGTFQAGETLNNLRQAGTITVAAVPAFEQTRVPSISMSVVEDGTAKFLTGARGTFSLAGNVGEAILISFQFNGLTGAPIDAGLVSGVNYTGKVPPVMLGVTLIVGDDADAAEADEFSPRFQAITLDHSSSIGIGRDAGETTGVYGSAHQTARASTGSITIDSSPEANYAFLAKLRSGDPSRIRLDIGVSEGNRFEMSVPAVVFTGETPGDQEGIATRDMPFRIASRNPYGNDRDDSELILTYIADNAP